MPRTLFVALLAPVALCQQPLPGAGHELEAARREVAAAQRDVAELRQLTAAPPPARGSFGVDATTEYFFRGILQENQGVIAQPWLTLTWPLLTGDGLLRELDLTFGLWNSLHDGPTRNGGSLWYEADITADLTAKLGERWSVGASYTVIDSPNGSFVTVQEVGGHVAFDDRELLLPNGLQPSACIAFESNGQGDGGDGLGIYAQLGLAPSFALGEALGLEPQLQLPVKLGLSLHDYYERPGGGGDDAFGYVDLGVVLATELPFAPAPAGHWQLSLGLHWLWLGDGNGARNGGDDQELLATVGLSASF